MPATSVRKHHTKSTVSSSTQEPAAAPKGPRPEPRKAEVTATAPKVQDPPSAGGQRVPTGHTATHGKTPSVAAPMAPTAPSKGKAVDTAAATKSTTSSTDRGHSKENVDSSRRPARPPPGASKCYLYTLGKCKRPNCPMWHPPSESLKPCIKFQEGRCDNPRCPRPHVSPEEAKGESREPAASDSKAPAARDVDATKGPLAPMNAGSSSRIEEAPAPPPPRSSRQRKGIEEECINFRKGVCRKGDACPRLHLNVADGLAKSQPPVASPAHPEAKVAPKTSSVSSCSKGAPGVKPDDSGSKPAPSLESKSCAIGESAKSTSATPTSVEVQKPIEAVVSADRAVPAVTQKERCKKFARGVCTRSRCPYTHEKDGSQETKAVLSRGAESGTEEVVKALSTEATSLVEEEVVEEPSVPAIDESRRNICRSYIYQKGKCPYGNKCTRRHLPVAEWHKFLLIDEDCEEFLYGECILGDNCWYRHPDASGQDPRRIQHHTPGQSLGSRPKSSGLPPLTIPQQAAQQQDNDEDSDTSPETSPLHTEDDSNPMEQRVCWDFLRNRCHRRACKFAHIRTDKPAPTLTADSSWSSMASEPPQKPPRMRGLPGPTDMEANIKNVVEQLRNSSRPPRHIVGSTVSGSAQLAPPAAPGQSTRTIPLFPPGLGIEQRLAAPLDPHVPEPPSTMSVNVLDAVHVVFGPGLEVQAVKTGFESRGIVIKGIPSKTTVEALTKILTPFGEVAHVYIPQVKGASTVTAKASLSSPEEAAKAVAGLNDTAPFGTTLDVQLAAQNSTSLGKGYLLDGDVRIEFAAPCKAAYIGFPTQAEAEAAMHKINHSAMGDCCLNAFPHEGVPKIAPFTVKVLGVPPDGKATDLDRFGRNSGVMLERPNYSDLHEALREIMAWLERCGNLIKLTILSAPFLHQTVLGWAHFPSPVDAEKACAGLHKRRLRSLGNDRVYARHTKTICYRLPVDVFDAIRADIITLQQQLGAGSDNCYIQWLVDREDNKRTVRIKLVASNLPALTRLKRSFEDILRGEKVTVDGQFVWDPFFSRPFGARYLEDLQREHRGVLINRDPRKRFIALFGPPSKREIVRSKLLLKVEQLRAQISHTFTLDGMLIGPFVSADLIKLQEQLGHENVLLDFTTRTLQIRGNEDAMQVTRIILRHARERHSLQRKHRGHTCPICLDDVSLPVSLPCGHSWCKSCLTGYLQSAVDTRVFPLTCMGDEGRCTLPIPVGIAKELLPSEKFSGVTHASFLAYIHSRPSEFFYCPTPDCPQVYRTAAPGTILQCPSCLVRICGSCHVESHEGTTCDQRDMRDKRLFEEWSRHRDVKDCPSCKTTIERISGCNHMTCAHCKTHICWECLAVFKKSEEVYDHMRQVHGNIGVPEFFF